MCAGPRKTCASDYPIAVDNDQTIWRAFKNQYWPALYFIDAQGRVRHHHFGEGGYEQSEMTFRNCWPRREQPASTANRCRSMVRVSKWPPIGAA